MQLYKYTKYHELWTACNAETFSLKVLFAAFECWGKTSNKELDDLQYTKTKPKAKGATDLKSHVCTYDAITLRELHFNTVERKVLREGFSISVVVIFTYKGRLGD